jgi:predicted transcriptional regulator
MARMTIELPNDIVEMVSQTAEKESVPKTEVLRRMFTILKITQEEKKKGNDLGIVNGEKVIARFVGV